MRRLRMAESQETCVHSVNETDFHSRPHQIGAGCLASNTSLTFCSAARQVHLVSPSCHETTSRSSCGSPSPAAF